MLRHDGEYNIYIIQQQFKKQGEWYYTILDMHIDVNNTVRTKEPYVSFTSSGKCWQDTGIIGTYDENTAIDLCVLLKKAKREHNFRVALLEITQNTKPVFE